MSSVIDIKKILKDFTEKEGKSFLPSKRHSITGVKDLDLLILSFLPLRALLRVAQVNHYLYDLVDMVQQGVDFWVRKSVELLGVELTFMRYHTLSAKQWLKMNLSRNGVRIKITSDYFYIIDGMKTDRLVLTLRGGALKARHISDWKIQKYGICYYDALYYLIKTVFHGSMCVFRFVVRGQTLYFGDIKNAQRIEIDENKYIDKVTADRTNVLGSQTLVISS